MSKAKYSLSIERADKSFSRWCKSQGIPLFAIHHVVTWEDWDDGIGVYIFLQTIDQVDRLDPGEIKELEDHYIACLRDHDYPFDAFPTVTFTIDSDENVRKSYAGSYFYRLR